MLNQIIKLTVITSIWVWLKPRWRGLAFLIAVILLVNILHSEYLKYVELSGNKEFLLGSYLAKWVTLILALMGYLVVFVWKAKSNQISSEYKGISEPDEKPISQIADDGFNFLREKDHLQNRAEKLIAGKGGNNGHNDK